MAVFGLQFWNEAKESQSMEELLEELLEECRDYAKEGHVATYIPELAK